MRTRRGRSCCCMRVTQLRAVLPFDSIRRSPLPRRDCRGGGARLVGICSAAADTDVGEWTGAAGCLAGWLAAKLRGRAS